MSCAIPESRRPGPVGATCRRRIPFFSVWAFPGTLESPMPTHYITLTRQELYDMVWAKLLSSLAMGFGISDVALAKRGRVHRYRSHTHRRTRAVYCS
jgi:hypothetical protein